ncbi:MAG: hypothetical protein ACFFER_18815 [Candidatus Thorarchaeota archaeon]
MSIKFVRFVVLHPRQERVRLRPSFIVSAKTSSSVTWEISPLEPVVPGNEYIIGPIDPVFGPIKIPFPILNPLEDFKQENLVDPNCFVLARVYVKNTGQRVVRQVRGKLLSSNECVKFGGFDDFVPLDEIYQGMHGWEPDKLENFGDIQPNSEAYALFAFRTKNCFPGIYSFLLEINSSFINIPEAFRIEAPPEREYDPEEWFFHIEDPKLRWMFEEWAEAFFDAMEMDAGYGFYIDVTPLDHQAEERELAKRTEGCA